MSLGAELLRLSFNSSRVFFVNFSFGFQCPPIGSNISPAFGGGFCGCPSRYPGEDAGGNGSANAGFMPLCEDFANQVNSD